jgi:hypothetical protein
MALDGHETMHQVFHRPIGWIRVGVDGSGLDDVHGDAARAEVTRQASSHPLQC